MVLGKTPGSAGPLPSFSELERQNKQGQKWDFWYFPGIPRSDGIQMREMINNIDKTIRMQKAGTVTGEWKRKMFAAQKIAEFDLKKRWAKTIDEDPTAEGLFDERLGTVPFDLEEVLIKDNRRCLESVLGGFPKGMISISLYLNNM